MKYKNIRIPALAIALATGLATQAPASTNAAPSASQAQIVPAQARPAATNEKGKETATPAINTPTKPQPTSSDGIKGDLKSLSRDEIRTLIRIVNMPPDRLASLRQSLEHLEKMTPEERQQLRKKLEALRSSPTLPPPQTNPLLHYWASLPPEKALDEKERFRNMTREERRAYVAEAIKKLPTPPADASPRPERRRFRPEHENKPQGTPP
ncbi:MAG: DUF3106 domain-containing protein [Puniceicoccales bacterium]|jgi:hypothetical protein|nr:DUF3106 domain-containing protein [Puniceicoccales bacterium]